MFKYPKKASGTTEIGLEIQIVSLSRDSTENTLQEKQINITKSDSSGNSSCESSVAIKKPVKESICSSQSTEGDNELTSSSTEQSF